MPYLLTSYMSRCRARYCYVAGSSIGRARRVGVAVRGVCRHIWRKGVIYTQNYRRAIQVIGVRRREEFRETFLLLFLLLL